MHRRTFLLAGAATGVSLAAAACGLRDDSKSAKGTPAPGLPPAAGNTAPSAAPTAAATSNTKAAELRTILNGLLSEHVALAASATGAALAGRQAQFEAVAASLDANSVDL